MKFGGQRWGATGELFLKPPRDIVAIRIKLVGERFSNSLGEVCEFASLDGTLQLAEIVSILIEDAVETRVPHTSAVLNKVNSRCHQFFYLLWISETDVPSGELQNGFDTIQAVRVSVAESIAHGDNL